MVATNDVVGVDRLVRVITSTMCQARFYQEDWPKYPLLLLDEIARQIRPLLKVFGRPLDQQLKLNKSLREKGLVLKERWAYIPEEQACAICFSEFGWVVVNLENDEVYHDCPNLIARLLGMKESGFGGASLFLEACAWKVAELFRERWEALRRLEESCLLERMYESFEKSKWTDTKHFIADLH